MKRAILLVLALGLMACESSRTINGKEVPCYGLNGKPRQGVEYEWSVRNILIGLLTPTWIPGIVVGFKEARCPVRP